MRPDSYAWFDETIAAEAAQMSPEQEANVLKYIRHYQQLTDPQIIFALLVLIKGMQREIECLAEYSCRFDDLIDDFTAVNEFIRLHPEDYPNCFDDVLHQSSDVSDYWNFG